MGSLKLRMLLFLVCKAQGVSLSCADVHGAEPGAVGHLGSAGIEGSPQQLGDQVPAQPLQGARFPPGQANCARFQLAAARVPCVPALSTLR